MTIQQGFPQIGAPFVNPKSGVINQTWLQLLISLWNRTGAAQGYNIGGFVQGPSSATDNAIARYDGTTGLFIQNSGATIDDSGNLTANNFSGSSSGTNTGDVTLSGQNYLSLVGQALTANAVNLSTANVSGNLPTSHLNNGTNANSGTFWRGDGVWAGVATTSLTGTLQAAQFPALTGDVTTTAGSLATTIATNVVTDSKFRQSSAETLVGNPTGVTADVQDITLGTGLFFTGTTLDTVNSGTVTSVALSMPAEFNVSGSPVTSSGTITVTKANESANTIYAGPVSGVAAVPTFRALTVYDLPIVDLYSYTAFGGL